MRKGEKQKQMGGDGGNDGAGERGGDALMSVFLVADTSCGVVLHLATSEDAAQVETSAFIRVCLYQPRLPGCVGTGTETHADTLTRIIVRSLSFRPQYDLAAFAQSVLSG